MAQRLDEERERRRGLTAAGIVQVVAREGPAPWLQDPHQPAFRHVGQDLLLREVACTDFSDLGGIAARFRGVDCCLFCLGTSVRNVDGEDEYRRIHVTYALAAARAVVDGSPGATFVYLSGAGAKRTSRMMWARLKAEAEDRLGEAGLLRLANVRPAAILPMEPGGLNRWLLAPLLKVFPFLGIGALDLGRAMLRIGLQGRWHGSRTYENKDLKGVLDGAGVEAPGSP